MSGLDNTLRALRAAGGRGCTGNELEAAGSGKRYSARITELNKRGYHIEPERICNNPVIFRWTLVSEPRAAPPSDAIAPVAVGTPAALGCEDTLFDLPAAVGRSAITGKAA